MLGEVVADQRQVHLVDKPVAHEGGQRLGLELGEVQAGFLLRQQFVAQRLQLREALHCVAAVVAHAAAEVVEVEGQGAFVDARVLAAQAVDVCAELHVDAAARALEGEGGGGVVDPVGAAVLRRGEGAQPAACESPALQRFCRLQVALPCAGEAAMVECALQGVEQVFARAADGPVRRVLGLGEFAHEVSGGFLGQGVGEGRVLLIGAQRLGEFGQPFLAQRGVLREELAQALRGFLLQRCARGGLREELGDVLRAAGAAGERLAGFVAQALVPVQLRQRPLRRAIDQQASSRLDGREHAHDGERVVVVDAALVALLVAAGGKAAQPIQRGGGCVVLQLHQQFVPVGGLQPFGGEVFGARELWRFRYQRLLPERAQRFQPRIVRGREVVGAGDLPCEAVAVPHQRQVQRLLVDREGVRAQLDATLRAR